MAEQEKLIDVCRKILRWWEDAQYKTTSLADGDEDNVFGDEEDNMFDELRNAIKDNNG